MDISIKQSDVAVYIASRIPFKASGLTARAGHVSTQYTALNDSDRVLYDLQSYKIAYTVLSYETPIAWYIGGEGWVIPNAHYSMTTSRHQGVVKRALANEPNIVLHDS